MKQKLVHISMLSRTHILFTVALDYTTGSPVLKCLRLTHDIHGHRGRDRVRRDAASLCDSGQMCAACIVLPSLGIVFVFLRFYATTLKKNSIGFDDWLMLPALVCSPYSSTEEAPHI